MKKVLAILAIVMLMFSSMAFATSARIDGLGVPVWMTDDDSIVTMFPGALASFSDLAVLEAENGGDALGMVNVGIEGGVLSIYQGPVLVSSADEIASVNSLLSLESSFTALTYQTGVMYTAKLDDTMSAGGGVFYAASSDEDKIETPDEDQDTFSQSSMNLGILLGLSMAGDMPVDIGLSVILPTLAEDYKNYHGTNIDELENSEEAAGSALKLGLNARAKLDLLTAMLAVGFDSASAENVQKTDAAGDGTWDLEWANKVESSLISVDLGASKTLSPMENVSVIVGGMVKLDLESGKYTYTVDTIDYSHNYTEDTTTIAIPLYIAGEAKVGEAWTVRCGVEKNVWNNSTLVEKYTNDDDEVASHEITQTSDMPDLSVSLGASVAVGDLLLDIALEEEFLLDGPFFISGDSNNFSTKIGMSYDWN